MRRVLIVLTLCFCSIGMQGQKIRFGQAAPQAKPGDVYPIKVHIAAIHHRTEDVGANQAEDVTYADAVIDGQKVELRGNWQIASQNYKLSLGDIQARLLRDPKKAANTPISKEYEVIFPDRTLWRCTVTGISE